jgi:hypothetical protein
MMQRIARYCGPTIILAAFALLALVVNSVVNYPYRPFPSDELWSYSIPLRGADWLGSGDDVLLNSPVHILTLLAVKPFVVLMGIEWFQTFLATVALALSGAAFLLGMTIQLVTGRTLLALGGMLLFLVSPWSQSYLHFYTYAPVAALFMMASLHCFTRFYLAGAGRRWLAAAGFLAGLFFLSSSSAKLMGSLLLVSYSLVILRSGTKGKGKQSLLLLGAAAIPVIGFAPLYFLPLLEHLRANAECGHNIICHLKYGLIPKTPWPSFFYLLSVYSLPLLISLSASLAVLLLRWRKIAGGGRPGLLLLVFAALILLHTVTLDLLPYTKLGRSQFVLLPLAISVITLLCANFPLNRVAGGWLFLGFIIVALPLEIAASTETWQVRRGAPSELESLPVDTICYVLKEDPHGSYLTDWLSFSAEQAVSLADLPRLVAERTSPILLVVGPTGPDSGKSILRHCILDDFSYTLPPGITPAPQEMKLPYYAHYPSFMMEEENSQFFYFTGRVPLWSAPQSQLTTYYWPARGR